MLAADALAGIAGQGASDVVTGHFSGLGQYAFAAGAGIVVGAGVRGIQSLFKGAPAEVPSDPSKVTPDPEPTGKVAGAHESKTIGTGEGPRAPGIGDLEGTAPGPCGGGRPCITNFPDGTGPAQPAPSEPPPTI